MILTAAKLALAIYEPYTVYRNIAADLGLRFHSRSTNPVHHWAAFENDEQMWIVHMGTKGFRSVLTDLFATSQPLKLGSIVDSQERGSVHSGFIGAWEEINSYIPYSRKPTIVTGHSKGAAVTQIHAMSRVVDHAYCFNSPKVFDAYAAKAYKTPTELIEIKGDLYSKLPMFYSKVKKPTVLESSAPMRARHSMNTVYESVIRSQMYARTFA